ncbi:ABC transporter substrate-binding protein [Microbacterium koreense]|uniref:ABC transporter substrate-binding protein n=1 Tax=Microbacterium koreense TaxID=323761 RepID=A0ABW2ZQ64_9MICO
MFQFTTTRRMRRRGLVAVVAAASLVALAGCASDDQPSGEGSEAVEYVVGFPAILSGPAAFAGVPIADGAKLAVKEINESGFLGEGSTIDLKIDDIKGDPAQAIALFNQYAADGASGILCCGLSSEAGALAPVITDKSTPAVVTSAILAGLADPPYIYRSVILPSEPGGMYDQFVDAIVPGEDIKTAVVVVTADNDGMVGDAKVWTEALERNGVEILKTIETSAADTNYTQAATEIEALNPDAVIGSTLGTPSALLAKSMRERGYDQPFLTSYGVDSEELFTTSGGGLEGTIFMSPFHAGFNTNEEAVTFVEAYEAEYGEIPDMYGAQGYTAMWLLAQGLKAAGDPDPQKVAETLEGITSQDSVYGPLTYSGGQASLDGPGVYLVWQADGTLEEWND